MVLFGGFFFAVFVGNLVAQTELVKATTAIENAVFVTMQWLASVKPSSGLLYTIAEELKSQVKKMGGFFQMLIQVRKKNTQRYHTLKWQYTKFQTEVSAWWR